MTILCPIEPLVAAADFNPFTRELPMPLVLQSPSTRPRTSLKGDAIATSRPRRRSLIELGLACGSGAAALDAEAATREAAERQADRAAASLPANGAELADQGDGRAAPEQGGPPPDPAAIAAAAAEIQAVDRKRQKLAQELAALHEQQGQLHTKLLQLLGRRPALPTGPIPAGPPPGSGLPR